MTVWIKTVIDKKPKGYYVDPYNCKVLFTNTGIKFEGIYFTHWFDYRDVVGITESGRISELSTTKEGIK